MGFSIQLGVISNTDNVSKTNTQSKVIIFLIYKNIEFEKKERTNEEQEKGKKI